MKKFLFPITILLLIAAGCKTGDPNDVDVKNYTLNDSVYFENEYNEGFSHFNVCLDLPITKNKTLYQSIIHWMLNDETEDHEAFVKSMRDSFFDEDGSEPGSVYEENYTLTEQTDKYVTYINEGSMYTGGAHAMPWYNGTTFSKIDGSIVGYDLFKDPEQLLYIIAENIEKQYFAKYEEEEGLMFEYDEINILPDNEPWIETDCVVFCYQPNEIAPFAAGMPLCKIALTDLEPYLSDKGKSFLNNPIP